MIDPFGLTKTEIKIFEMGETSGWSMGVKAEKQRIIKLLEEKLPKTLRLVYEVCIDETGLYDSNEAALVKDAFIALIRGEQK